jgi:hypothetical protein
MATGMGARPNKRFPWVIYALALLAILAVALAPVGSVVVCSWVANTHSCKVDEGSVHPCIIRGHDYGQLLYTLGVLGLADACYASWRRTRIDDLPDHSHTSSCKLAKATLCRFPLAPGPWNSVSAIESTRRYRR